jgi:hypothetical protein
VRRVAYKDKEKQKEAWRAARRRYLEKKKGMTKVVTGMTEDMTKDMTSMTEGMTKRDMTRYDLDMTGMTEDMTKQDMIQGMTRESVTPDTDDVTDDVTDEPELDPTVLYLAALSQRVDALAVEVTELKKVGSAIKIDSLVPVIKGMVEESLKEIEGRIVKLEKMVESLEDRVSKIEELLQEFQPGMGFKVGGYGGRHSSKGNGNGSPKFGKEEQVKGFKGKRYVFGIPIE